jgi:hypothetical protein
VKPGIVFIAEDMDNWPDVDVADLVRRGVDLRSLSPGDLLCWTGRFAAHWESDDGEKESDDVEKFRDGPEDVTVEEAIAWGRSHADVVQVRVGDGDLDGDEDGYFSAGARHPYPGVPVWPEGLSVTARPYQGPWIVWKDGYSVGGGSGVRD